MPAVVLRRRLGRLLPGEMRPEVVAATPEAAVPDDVWMRRPGKPRLRLRPARVLLNWPYARSRQ